MMAVFNLGDFIWQEVWQTCLHLFEVRSNDHLVNYFSLMHRCGINKNLLENVNHYSNTEWNNKWFNHICEIMLKRRNILPTRASLFQVQENLRACRNSKWSLSSTCLITGDKNYILAHILTKTLFCIFQIMSIYSKYFPIKVHQNCYDSSS